MQTTNDHGHKKKICTSYVELGKKCGAKTKKETEGENEKKNKTKLAVVLYTFQ